MNLFLGISASSGIGIGKAFVVPESEKRVIPQTKVLPGDMESEISKFDNALATVLTQIAAQMEGVKGDSPSEKIQREIFESYFLMLNDAEFIKGVKEEFSSGDMNMAFVLDRKAEQSARMLEASGNEYLSERAQDIRDVFGKVLDEMLDFHPFRIDTVPDGSVIVARNLNPSDTMVLSRRRIAGLALIDGGVSSHVGILARNFGIPAVFDLHKITELVKSGSEIIVDGNSGEVIDEPDEETIETYEKKIGEERRRLERLAKFRNLPARTKDGTEFKIMANIGSVEEAVIAAEEGADGIGLFRSEFLFMDEANSEISPSHARTSAFSEETQFLAYRGVLEAMRGKPVTIRTLDAGGDKIINSAEIKTHEEKNPLMGQRAIRLSLANPNQLKTQFRALFRAAKFGKLKIMLPLITDESQVKAALEIAKKAKEELLEEGAEFEGDVPIGIMVETAAAALISDRLAKISDFFSIGTNDLTQYTLGVDRENAHVAPLYDECHPAVLRLIEMTIDSARKEKIPVSVCGEMASREETALILCSLGIRTLSMSAKKICEMKEILSRHAIEPVEQV